MLIEQQLFLRLTPAGKSITEMLMEIHEQEDFLAQFLVLFCLNASLMNTSPDPTEAFSRGSIWWCWAMLQVVKHLGKENEDLRRIVAQDLSLGEYPKEDEDR